MTDSLFPGTGTCCLACLRMRVRVRRIARPQGRDMARVHCPQLRIGQLESHGEGCREPEDRFHGRPRTAVNPLGEASGTLISRRVRGVGLATTKLPLAPSASLRMPVPRVLPSSTSSGNSNQQVHGPRVEPVAMSALPSSLTGNPRPHRHWRQEPEQEQQGVPPKVQSQSQARAREASCAYAADADAGPLEEELQRVSGVLL